MGEGKKTFYLYLEPAPDQDLDKPCWGYVAESALPVVPPGHLYTPNSATKQRKSKSENVGVKMGFLEEVAFGLGFEG